MTHAIVRERQTICYLVEYYRRSGNTAAYLCDKFPGDNAVEWSGRPPFVTMSDAGLRARIGLSLIRAAAARVAGRPCSALGHLANCAYQMGIIAYRRETASGNRGRQAG